MLKKFNRFFKLFAPLKQEQMNYEAREAVIAKQDFLVRAVAVDDIKELIAVERQVYDGELPWTRSAFLSELYSPIPHLYLCILSRETIVGFIGSRVIGDDTHITNLAVIPEFQELGIGSFLIKEVEKFAEKNNSATLSLEVRISNQDAQRLYRKLGFVSRAVKKEYYTEFKEDALDMVKVLDE